MGTRATVCINNNFTAGHTAVTHRAAYNKPSGWIDKVLGVTVNHVSWYDGFNYFLHHTFFKVLIVYIRVVLG